MRTWLSLWLCALLVACAQAPTAPPSTVALFEDAAFAPPSKPIRAEEVFALSDEMARYLRHQIGSEARTRGAQRGLVEALYKDGELKLEYDSTTTRNAAQAFEARSGNCLSLVIMTAAFAKALDLRVEYQSAYAEETWSRAGNLYFRSGHVNITLGHRLADSGRSYGMGPVTVDFLPADEIRGLKTRGIGEATVIAMYMNHRAAEAMVDGRLDDAYWWAREAVIQDPLFLSGYNTLGVIYERHGNLARAEAVLRKVLADEPLNPRALGNLSRVAKLLGHDDEAAQLAQRLAQVEPRPAFYYFELGRIAMQRGDFLGARDLFAKEVERASYNHEFHFWLALANFRLGDVDTARKQLAVAIQNSTSRGDRDLYAAKLAWIRSVSHP